MGFIIVIALTLLGVMEGCGQSKTGAPRSASTAGPTSAEPATVTSPATSTAAFAGRDLPITAQSDSAMRAAANDGPSSSILAPSSCQIAGTTVTATGGLEGGLPPEVYARYGDVVELYVFSAAMPGYPDGIQLATLSSEHPPAIGGSASWTLTVSVESAPDPARCLVAAQPTHDFEGAPSAY